MRIQDMSRVAICTALLSVSSFIAFPLPFTPALVTALTIVINICALVLPPKQAFASVGMYLLLGILGLPVFAGTSGIGKMLGPTGGYYIGFLVAVGIMSRVKGKERSLKRYIGVTVGIGMPMIYIWGIIFMSFYQTMNLIQIIKVAILPFIIGDVIKCIASSYIALAINRALMRVDIVR